VIATLAGMPWVRLDDLAAMRIEAISFFVVVFLAATKVVQWLWNGLHRDFPWMPRLGYYRALGLVALWGLLFVVVLTMISGARELMTPGAWEKAGLTYKLADKPEEAPAKPPAADERRAKLVRLREALWAYATAHGGKLPGGPTDPDIAAEYWQSPDPSGAAYGYVSGRTPHGGTGLLAFEPPVSGDDVWALFANGDVRRMTAKELDAVLSAEATR
jgi:hypothetical protein